MRYTVIIESGNTFWYKEGTEILHREDGPACEHANGTKFWYLDGKGHREDGPAMEFANGDKFWYQHGKQHRLDGPACEFDDGSKWWVQNDKLHRLDGPAIVYASGNKYWYLEGKLYKETEFLKKTQPVMSQPAPFDGQMVDIGGIKYQLRSV